MSGRKETVLDLAKFVDKGVQIKLTGGRQDIMSHSEGDSTSHHSSAASHDSLQNQNPDDLLIPRNEFLSVTTHDNNHCLNLSTFKNPHFPILIEILKVHPLNHVLTYNPAITGTHVPEIYAQQFWKTCHVHTSKNGNLSIRADIDQYTISVTVDRLREIFRLPAADSRPPATNFDDVPDEALCMATIQALGYTGALEKKAQFKRNNLHPMYYVLLTILQKCLTPKHTGYEFLTEHQLKIFVAAANHLHVDYAQLFFNDFKATIQTKNSQRKVNANFLPYQRFIPMIIQHVMDRNPDIPRRAGYFSITPKMFRIAKPAMHENPPQPQPLPISLLDLCEQNDLVVSYRLSVGVPPLVRPAPALPTQGGVKPSENIETRPQSSAGDAERVVQSENSENGGEAREEETHRKGGDAYDPESVRNLVESLTYTTTQPDSPSHTEQVEIENSESNGDEYVFMDGSTPLFQPDPSPIGTPETHIEPILESIPYYMKVTGPVTSSPIPVTTTPDLASTIPITTPASQGGIAFLLELFQRQVAVPGLIHPQPEIELEPSVEPDASVTPSDSPMSIDRYAGYCLGSEEADSSVFMSEGAVEVRKEQECAEGPLAVKSRDATSSIGPDTVIPTVHLQTPPSHYGASQQAPSLLHRDIAHTLRSSHSEMVRIEQRGPPPSSSPISSVHIDIPRISAYLSKQSNTMAQLAHLCQLGPRTSVGGTISGTMRESEGNPAGVNLRSSPVGGYTFVAGTSTGNLSDSGFVTRAELNDLIQQAVTPLHQKLDKLKSILTSRPQPTTDPSTLSLDSLKSLLYVKLLEQTPEAEHNNDLLTILRNEQTFRGSILNEFKEKIREMIDEFAIGFYSEMSKVNESLKAVEEACKVQEAGQRRKRDDRDPDDRPEGEKRRRYLTSTAARLLDCTPHLGGDC